MTLMAAATASHPAVSARGLGEIEARRIHAEIDRLGAWVREHFPDAG